MATAARLAVPGHLVPSYPDHISEERRRRPTRGLVSFCHRHIRYTSMGGTASCLMNVAWHAVNVIPVERARLLGVVVGDSREVLRSHEKAAQGVPTSPHTTLWGLLECGSLIFSESLPLGAGT